MAKKKDLPSDSSSEEVNSNVGHSSKSHIDKILATAALNSKQQLLKEVMNQSFTDRKSNSHLAKKGKRGEICASSNSSSDENNVSNRSNNKIKQKRSSKGKSPSYHDSPGKIKLNRQLKRTREDSDSESIASYKNKRIKDYCVEQMVMRNVKKEVLSDDGDSEDKSVPDYKSIIGNEIVKDEEYSQVFSSSEAEDRETSRPLKRASNNSAIESSPVANKVRAGINMQSELSDSDSDDRPRSRVTVLQDICLTPKSKTPKEKLKGLYPGSKLIESTAELRLSDSDEIYLFRIPKNVDPKLLKKAQINIESECKIDLGEKYVIKPTSKIPHPTFVVSANSRVVQFKNNIIMEKYIKSKKEPHFAIPEKRSVPLPENLKKRHPLFGLDFHQKIKLSEQVERKLDEAIKSALKREKKLKKKMEKKANCKEREEPSVDDQEIFNLLNSRSFSTNNVRVKKEVSDDSAFGSSSSIDKLKGKSKKHKSNVSDIVIKTEVELPTEEEESAEHRTPKKKKKAKAHNLSWPEISNIKREIKDIDGIDTGVQIKKDRRNSAIITSTLMSDISRTPKFYPEISTIMSEPSTSGVKSKKHKKDKKYENVKKETIILDLLHNVTEELNISKISKKKKHKEAKQLDKTVKSEF